MKAAVINQYGGRENLTVVDTAVPAIQADEVLVENIATSINPIDYKAREGLLQRMFQWAFPVVLGWDVAGKIVAVGDAGQTLKSGMRCLPDQTLIQLVVMGHTPNIRP